MRKKIIPGLILAGITLAGCNAETTSSSQTETNATSTAAASTPDCLQPIVRPATVRKVWEAIRGHHLSTVSINPLTMMTLPSTAL